MTFFWELQALNSILAIQVYQSTVWMLPKARVFLQRFPFMIICMIWKHDRLDTKDEMPEMPASLWINSFSSWNGSCGRSIPPLLPLLIHQSPFQLQLSPSAKSLWWNKSPSAQEESLNAWTLCTSQGANSAKKNPLHICCYAMRLKSNNWARGQSNLWKSWISSDRFGTLYQHVWLGTVPANFWSNTSNQNIDATKLQSIPGWAKPSQ